QPMGAVITGARLFEAAILDGGETAAIVITVLRVDRLGVCIEGLKVQTPGHPLLDLYGARVEGAVPEVGADSTIAELRSRTIVLTRGQHRIPKRRVSGKVVDGERIVLPALHQANARRTLVADLQQVVLYELVLHAHVEVQHVGVGRMRIPPFHAAR